MTSLQNLNNCIEQNQMLVKELDELREELKTAYNKGYEEGFRDALMSGQVEKVRELLPDLFLAEKEKSYKV